MVNEEKLWTPSRAAWRFSRAGSSVSSDDLASAKSAPFSPSLCWRLLLGVLFPLCRRRKLLVSFTLAGLAGLASVPSVGDVAIDSRTSTGHLGSSNRTGSGPGFRRAWYFTRPSRCWIWKFLGWFVRLSVSIARIVLPTQGYGCYSHVRFIRRTARLWLLRRTQLSLKNAQNIQVKFRYFSLPEHAFVVDAT